MQKVAFLLGFLLIAQPGQALDLSADPDLDLWDHGAILAAHVAADGSFLVGGNFMQFMGLPRSNLARVNADGSLDENFNPVVDGWVFDILAQNDGSVIIAGSFTAVNGVARSRLARLHADGSLDVEWSPAANDDVWALTFANDQQLIVAGEFAAVNGLPRSRIARVSLVDGSLDGSWQPSVNGEILAVEMDNLSRLWIGGRFTAVNGQQSRRLARLNETGDLDLAFDVDESVHQIQIDADGKTYVCGYFREINGTQRSGLARLDGVGMLDLQWSPEVNLGVTECRLNEDELLLAGQITAVNDQALEGFARISAASGEVDAKFLPFATGAYLGNDSESSNWVIERLDGQRILVGGGFRYLSGEPSASAALVDSESGNLLVALDAEFRAEIRRAVVELSDGSWLVGGTFRRSGSHLRDNLLRLHPDGSLDEDWYMATSGPVLTATRGPGQSIFIGGLFNRVDEFARSGIARIDTDGSWTLNPDWAPQLDGTVLVIQPDQVRPGQLYVAGLFALAEPNSGFSINNLARVSAHGLGEPDTDMADTLINSQINAVAQTPDGRVFVGGTFSQAGGVPRWGLAAFEDGPDFAFDDSFNANLNNSVWGLKFEPSSSSVYVAGQFTSAMGVPRTRIFKLGPEFSTWAPQITNGTPIALELDGFGGLYVGGSFRTVNGVSRTRLARIDTTTGILDATFSPPVNERFVWHLRVAQDRLMVAGDFTRIGGLARRALAAFDLGYPLPDGLFMDRFEASEGGTAIVPVESAIEEACSDKQASFERVAPRTDRTVVFIPSC